MQNCGESVIRQFAERVTDFSSQYGAENSSSFSYCVENITGQPQIMPAYGDYTKAAVLRTYGPWWKPTHSAEKKIRDSRPRSQAFFSEDYIELEFEKAVIPTSIHIYETYNPGAVVRILALHSSVEKILIADSSTALCPAWEILWECSASNPNVTSISSESRIFSPHLRPPRFLCKIIRLEFNSRHLQYYTELDAVELIGTELLHLSSSVDPPYELLYQMSIGGENPDGDAFTRSKNIHAGSNGYFDLLPTEILKYIFSLLSLPDLCRCAATCKLFCSLSYDPSQFTVIDLSSCWHKVNNNALMSVIRHCTAGGNTSDEGDGTPTQIMVKSIDLSWCGGGSIASGHLIEHFFKKCSSSMLIQLAIPSSPVVTDTVLSTIANTCSSLSYLDIQSCVNITQKGLEVLSSLHRLITLNLYRTKVDDDAILSIIRSNSNLKHLNLGSCIRVLDYDRVLTELSKCCPELCSLDCWRARNLTHVGIIAIAGKCRHLEELELGWCAGLQNDANCIQSLASNCPTLTKLRVTANRTITDADVNALAENCLYLEQLDILGTKIVTLSSIRRLLHSCENLKLLDVSFCLNFTKEAVNDLQESFPHVSIKRSFQDE